ncbi:MAG: 6-phosphofructokinase, partial [Alphaproteobacteria bacterium]
MATDRFDEGDIRSRDCKAASTAYSRLGRFVRIGILTGGGDVPGLNSCIKAVVTEAQRLGWEVVGFRRGWAGPLHANHDDEGSLRKHLMVLDANAVRGIDRTGGTILHTSRTNPGRVAHKDLPDHLHDKFDPQSSERHDCTDHVMEALDKLEIGALIAIGGDDTLSYT